MNKLSFIDLELMPAGLARRAKGMMVFLLGLVLLLATLTHYVILRQRIDALEHQDNSVDQSKIDSTKPVSSAEIKAINSSIEQLSLPWTALFTALESVDAGDTSLISIEPDPQKASVKIVAEAPDVYEMLEYQRGLASQPSLKDVVLAQYETREDKNSEAVRFVVTATWGAAK